MTALAKDWNQGGGHLYKGQGRPNLRDLISPLMGVASLTELRAIDSLERYDGMLARVAAAAGEQQNWKYIAASALTEDSLLVVTPSDTPDAGRWVRVDSEMDLALAATFALADAAVLLTVPVGFILRVTGSWWKVTTSWTGGSSSAIGLSSSGSGLTTKGDILGGASGDVAAGLLSTGAYAKGTVGAKMAAPHPVLVAGETIRFDRITSVFTAGVGVAHLSCQLIAAP